MLVKTRTAGKLLKTTTSRLLNIFQEHWGSTKTIQVCCCCCCCLVCVWWRYWFDVWQPVTNTPLPSLCGDRRKRTGGAVVQKRDCWTWKGNCSGAHPRRYLTQMSRWCKCDSFKQHGMFTGDQYERARRLQDKMVTNLSMAKDRLALLG